MKKIISLLLSIMMLVSVMPVGITAFAEENVISEEMQMEFVERLNTVRNPDEIRHILEENEWAIEVCENYAMYMDADSEKVEEVANLLMFELPIDNMYDFVHCFDSCIVLAYINLAVSPAEMIEFIEIHADLLGLDMAEYNALTDTQKIQVMRALYEYQFICVDELRDRFYTEVEKVKNNSAVGGGSSGGGGSTSSGGYSSVWSYTYDINGNVMNEPPADGTEVLLKLQVRYQGTPCTYTVGLYNSNGAMKAVETFESYASKKGESQFYEFNTKYFSDCLIKTFSMESMDTIVPVDDVQYEGFFFGEGIPQPETETEGITAYKGDVKELYADSFDIRVHDKRAFGYWGAECEDEIITVNGMFPQLVLYMDNPEAVYNIKELDGEYYVDSIEAEGEIKTVMTRDVVNFDGFNLEFYENNELVSYAVDPVSVYSYYEPYYGDMSVLFENEEVVHLYIVDGKIKSVHALSSYAEKIMSVARGQVVTAEGGRYYLDEFVGYIPEAGDVIIITPLPEYYCDTAKAEKIEGRYFGDMFMTDDSEVYDLKYWGQETFYSGEKCYGYLDTATNIVKYVEKAPKDVIFVEKCHFDELYATLEIRTQNGVMDITNARFLQDGMRIQKTEEIYSILSSEIPSVYLLSEYNGRKYIETTRFIYEGQGRYFTQTNTLGGYILRDDIQIVAYNGEEIIDDINLTSGMTYNFKVYSRDGINAHYIIINDENNQLSQQKVTMIATSVSSKVDEYGDHYDFINGYKDSEEFSLKVYPGNSVVSEIQPGDIIVASVEDDEAVSIEIMARMNNMALEEKGSKSLFSPIMDASEEALLMMYDGTEIYTMVIDGRTDIYLYDRDNDTVKPAEVSDILFTNPMYGYRDWALVYTTGGMVINNLIPAEIVLIVPNN